MNCFLVRSIIIFTVLLGSCAPIKKATSKTSPTVNTPTGSVPTGIPFLDDKSTSGDVKILTIDVNLKLLKERVASGVGFYGYYILGDIGVIDGGRLTTTVNPTGTIMGYYESSYFNISHVKNGNDYYLIRDLRLENIDSVHVAELYRESNLLYFKNGKQIFGKNLKSARVQNITFDNGHTYAAGVFTDLDGKPVIGYTKDEVLYILRKPLDPSEISPLDEYRIGVLNGDVYLTCHCISSGAGYGYWKNNSWNQLGTALDGSVVSRVVTTKNDVYFFMNNGSGFWKNGTWQDQTGIGYNFQNAQNVNGEIFYTYQVSVKKFGYHIKNSNYNFPDDFGTGDHFNPRASYVTPSGVYIYGDYQYLKPMNPGDTRTIQIATRRGYWHNNRWTDIYSPNGFSSCNPVDFAVSNKGDSFLMEQCDENSLIITDGYWFNDRWIELSYQDRSTIFSTDANYRVFLGLVPN